MRVQPLIIHGGNDPPHRGLRVRPAHDTRRHVRNERGEHGGSLGLGLCAVGGGPGPGLPQLAARGPHGLLEQGDVFEHRVWLEEGLDRVADLAFDGAAEELVEDDDDGAAAEPIGAFVEPKGFEEEVADGLDERLELAVSVEGRDLRLGLRHPGLGAAADQGDGG